MTLAKLFGWLFALTLAAACLYTLAILGRLMFYEDPHTDPLPLAIAMFGNMAFAALPLVLSGIAYIVCRLLRV